MTYLLDVNAPVALGFLRNQFHGRGALPPAVNRGMGPKFWPGSSDHASMIYVAVFFCSNA
jgi:hypothetical protein